MVKSKAVSPTELLDAHIDRINAVNRAINAVVVDRFDDARAEAKAAEKAVMAGDPVGPFHGVPCTVKEYMEMVGLPNTGGIMALKHKIGVVEAPVVSRVRQAGAIVMGLTNVPEGGLWMEADSKVYGRASNPWNVRHTPGGSSGGEGAIVAAGGSPFGLGADIGGSIRIPAAFCGTVGHKPTGGLVPSTGHFPGVDAPLARTLCLGPLTRHTEDLMPLLRILAGPDGQCPGVRPFELGDPAAVNLKDLTVFRLDAGRWPFMRDCMVKGIDDAAASLEARGARIEHLDVRGLARGVEIWAAKLEEASPETNYGHIISPDRPFKPYRELFKLLLGRSRHTLPAVVMCAAEDLTRLVPNMARSMIELGDRLQDKISRALGQDGVFLYPPYTRTAPRHRMALATPFDPACTCIFSVMEFPITVVPVGFSDGLPVAVQVGANHGQDHLAIAAARALEQELGGWTRANP